MASTNEHDLIDALRSAPEELPRELHDAVLAKGADIVPALVDLLEADDEDGDSPDGGWGPIHAVDLLVDLKAKDAILPMLEILGETDWEHVIHDKIISRLPSLGELVLEPALAMLDEAADEPEFEESLCCVLSMLGVRDERIFSALGDVFASSPITGAMCLGDYGDPRGLPMVEEAIEEFEIDWEAGVGIVGLDELVHAYTQLEGELPEALKAHVDALRAEWKATGRDSE